MYQQCEWWAIAGVFEAMTHDLPEILRMAEDRKPQPTVVILDSHTRQSTPTSGKRAGHDGTKRRK